MTITKETIGRLPLNVGDYDELVAAGRTSFWRKNRVCRYGCEWESLMDGNTHAPATLVDGAVVADTEHWKLISGVPENYARPGAVVPVSVVMFNALAERVASLEQRIGGGEEPGGGEAKAAFAFTLEAPTSSNLGSLVNKNAVKPSSPQTIDMTANTKPTLYFLVYPLSWETIENGLFVKPQVVDNANNFQMMFAIDEDTPTLIVDGVEYRVCDIELGKSTYTITF